VAAACVTRVSDKTLIMIIAARAATAKLCLCVPACLAEFKKNPGATLHLWTTDKDAWTTVTAHSNPDGTYR
jgi:hypothetical protein